MTSRTAVALVLTLGLAWLPALGLADEVQVSVQESSFSWTGKRDGTAGFEWSARVENPARREVTVEVTLVLLDDDDAVVATESRVVTLEPEAVTPVGDPGSLTWDEARAVSRFRIGLRAAGDVP